MNPSTDDRAIAVWYEHPEWFRPLFAEFDRRGIPHVKLHAARHRHERELGRIPAGKNA